jgi:hypothetical protein
MRLLFITRHYPPEVSGGARRPFGFVTCLRELGCDVTLCGPSGIDDFNLIAVKHPVFPITAQGPLKNTASPIDNVMNFARRHLLWPDPEIRWAMRVVKAVRASKQSFDWVITSSPPESLHVAGRLLQKGLGCQWVADVRDLWIESPQRSELAHSPIRRAIERAIAKRTLGNADCVVAVSEAVLGEARRFATRAKPAAVIGHFALPFVGQPEKLSDDSFNIVHTGAISLSNPLSDFGCLLSDFEGVFLKRADARLILAGHLTPYEKAMVQNSVARDRIDILGAVSMTRARALQLGADALALVSGRTSHALPGKFSEYVQANKPILLSAVGPWSALIPKDAPVHPFQAAADLPKQAQTRAVEFYDAMKASADLLALLKQAERPTTVVKTSS